MANTYVNIDMAVRKTSVNLENSLKFGKRATRRYDDKFKINGAKIGDSIRVRIPPRYLAYKQEALGNQDSTETFRTLTLEYAHVPLRGFSLNDITLKVNDFADNFLKPAAITLGNLIDLDGTKQYKKLFNRVGTVAVAGPTDLDTYLLAQAKMMEEGVPDDGEWSMCINPEMNRQIVDALKGLYHSGAQLTPQYEKGRMDSRTVAGWIWGIDQNMARHTCGSRVASSAAVVDGANQTGTSLLLKTAGNALTVTEGDVFTIADVYAVNPQSRESTGRLRQFRVTAAGTSSAGGALTLSIYPAIAASGTDQTVDSLPADEAAIVYNGAASATGAIGIGFQKEAFILTMVDEELPVEEGAKAGRTTSQDAAAWNVSLSFIQQYNIESHKVEGRLGCLYGWLTARPELAIGVASN